MRRQLDQILDQLTPVGRVQVAIWSSTPFFVIVLIGHGLALRTPEVRAGLQADAMLWLQWLVLACTVVNLVIGVRLWPRRHLPDPVDAATLAVCLSIGLAYTAITILAGTFTASTNLVLVGVLAVGLLLFPMRPMVVAYVVCVGLLLLSDLAVLTGWLPYALALTPDTFQGREPVWWFALWRQFVFVSAWLVMLTLLLVLFSRLEQLHARLTRLSYTDGLTGLANRRRFMEVLASELARHQRFGRPLCLMLMDVDHFKHVNDRHGHLAGDAVLRGLAVTLMASVRAPSDLPARLGGEEFAIVLPDTDLDAARQVGERLRQDIASQVFRDADVTFGVTVSLGLIEVRGQDMERALLLVDQALYRAKESGRNRVCVAGEPAQRR